MKKVSFCQPAVLLLSACSLAFAVVSPAPPVSGLSIRGEELFTATDAEKILGEPASLTDSATTLVNGVRTYQCAYKANAADPATGKTGVVYFMLEQYAEAEAAQASYAAIKKSNEDHEGVEVLHDLGDEAYYHSDGQNFTFILVRVGSKMFRMKVNKLTGNTDLDQFRQVAENISRAV